MAGGAAIWEPCGSESESLRWVKNRALVARQGVEEGSSSSIVSGQTGGQGGEGMV